MSRGRAINSFYLSDPFEIRQTAISEDVISRVAYHLRIKTFTRKTGVRPIDRLLWMKHVLTYNEKLQGKLNPATYESTNGKKHI